MWERFKNDKNTKELFYKLITVLIVASIALLTFDVMTTNNDGRKQIVDEDGGTEVQLAAILGDIKGVGDVDVMITYDEKSNVAGVIVTSSGAGNVIVKNDITNAVKAVFNISASNVTVFEKRVGDLEDDKN